MRDVHAVCACLPVLTQNRANTISPLTFSSVQDSIYSLGIVCDPQFLSEYFPSAALETVLMLVWLMTALSRLFKTDRRLLLFYIYAADLFQAAGSVMSLALCPRQCFKFLNISTFWGTRDMWQMLLFSICLLLFFVFVCCCCCCFGGLC